MSAVTLPWPTGVLWPNSRPHWSVRAKHVAKARRDAWALCLEAGLPKGEAKLRVTFRPPRKPGLTNIDGAIAACKAAIDGIADALGVDDSRLRIEWPMAFGDPVKGGSVVVEIAPISLDDTATCAINEAATEGVSRAPDGLTETALSRRAR